MADETPEQASAPAAGGGAGEGGGAHAAAPAPGGIKAFLPLIIVLVLTPALAIGTIQIKSMFDKKKAAAPAEEHGEAEKEKEEAPKKEAAGGHGESKDKPKKKGKNTRITKIPIPLTRDAVAYHFKNPDIEGDLDKFVLLDLKGEPRDEAKSDKVLANIANTQGTRFAVARFSLLGEHAELVERVNLNRERLLDIASGALSSKSLDDIEKPGFRNLLRQELRALFDDVLGRGTIQEVVITEFVIQ